MAKKVLIKHLQSVASNRPPGYLDRCRAEGTVDGDYLVFTDEAWKAIAKEFLVWCPVCRTHKHAPKDCSTLQHRARMQSVWPDWAREIAASKTPGESGVGDSAFRRSSEEGFSAWMRSQGVRCECALEENRQKWNLLYPYVTEPG